MILPNAGDLWLSSVEISLTWKLTWKEIAFFHTHDSNSSIVVIKNGFLGSLKNLHDYQQAVDQ